MKKLFLTIILIGTVFLSISLSGCGSPGSSTGYSSNNTTYVHRKSWDYDRYYRTGANRHYRQSISLIISAL